MYTKGIHTIGVFYIFIVLLSSVIACTGTIVVNSNTKKKEKKPEKRRTFELQTIVTWFGVFISGIVSISVLFLCAIFGVFVIRSCCLYLIFISFFLSLFCFSFEQDYYCYCVAVACRLTQLKWCKDTKRAITLVVIFLFQFLPKKKVANILSEPRISFDHSISTHHHFICWRFVILNVHLYFSVAFHFACDLFFSAIQKKRTNKIK